LTASYQASFDQEYKVAADTTWAFVLVNYDASNPITFTVTGDSFVPKEEECFSCLTASKQYCTNKAGTNDCEVDNSGCTDTLITSLSSCYDIPSIVTNDCSTQIATIDSAAATFTKTLTIPANNGCKFSVASTSVKSISFATDVSANTHIYKGTSDPTLIPANKVTLGQANSVASGGSLYFAMFNDHATSDITVTVTGTTISYVE